MMTLPYWSQLRKVGPEELFALKRKSRAPMDRAFTGLPIAVGRTALKRMKVIGNAADHECAEHAIL